MDYKSIPAGSKLELYTSPTCPYCREACAYYDREHIAYTVYDAQNDGEARLRMLAFTAGDPTVPAIIVGGRYVRSGWGDPPRG